ncbi:hypothetical protein D7Y04_12685 [Corallococcus sp. AB038B]|nr:hypothetical protein D7Y04_12685 [Corallococcus sp. AB038B]
MLSGAQRQDGHACRITPSSILLLLLEGRGLGRASRLREPGVRLWREPMDAQLRLDGAGRGEQRDLRRVDRVRLEKMRARTAQCPPRRVAPPALQIASGITKHGPVKGRGRAFK